MTKPKVLITEDHELYRDGLSLLVREAIPDVRILEAGDLQGAKTALQENPDILLILFDLQIPGTRGLDGLAEIKALYPALPLIVVSTIDHYASIEQMLRLGADGFISKTTPKSAMVQAIRDIMDGEMVIISGQDQQGAVRLSPRQSAILELVSLGLSNKEIAAQINISPATVREHVSNLLERLDCENRTQMVLKARRLGFLLD